MPFSSIGANRLPRRFGGRAPLRCTITAFRRGRWGPQWRPPWRRRAAFTQGSDNEVGRRLLRGSIAAAALSAGLACCLAALPAKAQISDVQSEVATAQLTED